jgi:hypothetical protein
VHGWLLCLVSRSALTDLPTDLIMPSIYCQDILGISGLGFATWLCLF